MAMEERASLKMVAFMEEIILATTCQTTVGLDTLEEKLSRRDLAGWVGESCESLAADITPPARHAFNTHRRICTGMNYRLFVHREGTSQGKDFASIAGQQLMK